MSITILRAAAALYVVGGGAYLLFFARPKHARAARVGLWFVALAFVVQGASIGVACKEFGGAEFFNLRGGFGLLAWVGAGAFLLLERYYPLPAIGAFIIPLILIALLPGVLGLGPEAGGVVPSVIRLPALKLHVSSASLSDALFAIAFAVALMYLLQEREVKGKHFGALFSRLPSLQTLDQLNQRLVRLGFAIYSVALVTGSIVAHNAWGSFWTWDPQMVASLLVWLFYGALVQLHHVGVHGRRYAWLSLAGFALVLTSIIALGALPSVTRHGGNFQ
jgi:ABC-type transport system involved in cytochrome c biogenesis permease subunit